MTAFWSRTLKEFNPLNVLQPQFRTNLVRHWVNYRQHIALTPKSFFHVCILYGGSGWFIHTWAKNRFHQTQKYH